jgi:hypothetical protein
LRPSPSRSAPTRCVRHGSIDTSRPHASRSAAGTGVCSTRDVFAVGARVRKDASAMARPSRAIRRAR